MNILAIDIGHYSIKFIESVFERKQQRILSAQEIVITNYAQTLPAVENVELLQLQIIKDYLEERNFEGRIVTQVPSPYLTHRFLTLPVSNKKKAELMIPFQLDKDLPFSSQESHYTTQYIQFNKKLFAIVSIAQLAPFQTFFNKLEQNTFLPSHLVSEASLFINYVFEGRQDSPFCILDIGHQKTSAYFFHNRRPASVHLSYTAGKIFDEVIAETYQIPLAEAVKFKHQNSFFLTEEQYVDATHEQREFALLMKQAISPLVREIKKWELGHRINYGVETTTLFLTGGSSNIKNIANFLTQSLNIKTEYLKPFAFQLAPNLPSDQVTENTFGLCYLMGTGLTNKIPVANFRSGSFSSTDLEELPLHSAAFIGVRVIILTLIVVFSLVLERFMTNRKIDHLDLAINNHLQNPLLNIPRNDRRKYKINPASILEKVQQQHQVLQQKISLLQSVVEVDAVTPLITLTQKISPLENMEMLKFGIRQGLVSATFQGKEMQDLEQLKGKLETLGFPELKSTEDPLAKTITIEYEALP